MNEQIKAIIDRARRLLAGIAGTHVNVTLVGDRIEAHRAFHTQSPAIITTLCDALEAAERRAEEAEARDAHNRAEVDRVIGPTLAAMKRAGIDSLPDATDELLRRLDAAEARVAELQDRAGIAEGREACAKANVEQMAGWLDARNAGLVQMARERDALRAEVEALKAQRDVARQDARRAENERDALRDEAGPRLTVAELQRESYDTACAKGWHDEDLGPVSPAVHEIALAGLRIASTCDDIEAVRKGADPRKARRSMMLAGVNHWQARALSWLALVCTEAAEAMDDVMAERWTTTMREDGKPDGIGSELADIIIRVCDTAGALGLDMEAELRAKLAFNRTRSHKHGGKLA